MHSADGQAHTGHHDEEQQPETEEVQQQGHLPVYETCMEELEEQGGDEQHDNQHHQLDDVHQQASDHQHQHLQQQPEQAAHPRQPQHQEQGEHVHWEEGDEDAEPCEEPAAADDRQPYWDNSGALILPLPGGLPSEAPVRVELNGAMLPPASTEKVRLVQLKQGWGKVGPLRSIKPLIEGAEQLICCTYQAGEEGCPVELLLRVQWGPPSAENPKVGGTGCPEQAELTVP